MSSWPRVDDPVQDMSTLRMPQAHVQPGQVSYAGAHVAQLDGADGEGGGQTSHRRCSWRYRFAPGAHACSELVLEGGTHNPSYRIRRRARRQRGVRLSGVRRLPTGGPSKPEGSWQLFAKHTTEGLLQWFAPGSGVVAKRRVDQRLIAPAAACVRLIAEPLDQIVIQSNRDPCLARRRSQHRSTFTLSEVVLPLHVLASYWLRSWRVALRAEMSLTVSPRHVYTTTRMRPSASAASVTNHCSLRSVSTIVIASSSCSAVAASSKSTRCFRRFD